MWLDGACDSGGELCRIEDAIYSSMNEGAESIDKYWLMKECAHTVL